MVKYTSTTAVTGKVCKVRMEYWVNLQIFEYTDWFNSCILILWHKEITNQCLDEKKERNSKNLGKKNWKWDNDKSGDLGFVSIDPMYQIFRIELSVNGIQPQ